MRDCVIRDGGPGSSVAAAVLRRWVSWQRRDVEIAALQVRKDAANRTAPGDQLGFGVRWQKPLNEAWILRADSIVANRGNADDLFGARLEIRRKF